MWLGRVEGVDSVEIASAKGTAASSSRGGASSSSCAKGMGGGLLFFSIHSPARGEGGAYAADSRFVSGTWL